MVFIELSRFLKVRAPGGVFCNSSFKSGEFEVFSKKPEAFTEN
jgi:hypothetical protein